MLQLNFLMRKLRLIQLNELKKMVELVRAALGPVSMFSIIFFFSHWDSVAAAAGQQIAPLTFWARQLVVPCTRYLASLGVNVSATIHVVTKLTAFTLPSGHSLSSPLLGWQEQACNSWARPKVTKQTDKLLNYIKSYL